MSRKVLALFIPVIALFSFLFGWQIGSVQSSELDTSATSSNSKEEKNPADSADLKIFWDVWKRLQEKYVDPSILIPREQVYGAIRGMVASLDDPYTVYMSPEETTEFQNSLNGTLEGIGAELTVKEKQLVVVTLLKSSPAEKAGLKPNDIILKINDDPAADMTVYEAITKIRGKRGTQVNLLILRQQKNLEPFEVTITRDKINLNSVTLEEKGSGIFYLGIHQFTDRTKDEFNTVTKDLLLKNPKGLIMDLRSNGGGYLDVAVDILSEFLSGKKEAVKIRRRGPEKPEDAIYVSGSPAFKDIPLVVLVNGASASASEIVAGAIQDHKRGIVIGETTFGKGSVQEVETLPDKSSLRVTIAKWLTPKGRSIDHVGIPPDTEVKLSEEDLTKGLDPQMDKAIQYLKGLK